MNLIIGKDIDFYYITDSKYLDSAINILNKQELLGVDTETYALFSVFNDRASGLDPYTSDIRLIQINYLGNKSPYIFDILKIGKDKIQPLIDLLNNPSIEKVFFNSSFDLKILYHNFGIWLANAKCCRVSMKLLGQCTGYKTSLTRGFSYKAMVRDYFLKDISKAEQNSDWGSLDLRTEQLEYAALDVGSFKYDSQHSSYLLEGYKLFNDILLNPLPDGFDIGFILNLEQDANNITSKVEYTGLPVNKNLLFKFLEAATKELNNYKIKICKLLNISPNTKMVMTASGIKAEVYVPEEVSKLLNSPKKLGDYVNEILGEKNKLDNMQTASLKKLLKSLEVEAKKVKLEKDIEEESEDEEFLEEEEDFTTGIELIDSILEYKKLVKLVEKDWDKLINIKTGCIHANVNSIGAATGRMSSSGEILGQKFNAQQLNKKDIELEIKEDLVLKSSSTIN